MQRVSTLPRVHSFNISSRQQRRNLRQERRENQLEHDRQIRDRRRNQRIQQQQQQEQPVMAANAANPPELAAALSMVGDNDMAKDFIADALNAIKDS